MNEEKDTFEKVMTETREQANKLSDLSCQLHDPEERKLTYECAVRLKEMVKLVRTYDRNINSAIANFVKVNRENEDKNYRIVLMESVLDKEIVDAVNTLSNARRKPT